MTERFTRKEKDYQKSLIGDFIVEFEMICAAIRFIIQKIVYPNPDWLQETNIEILLEGLTADQLRRKIDALIQDNYELDLNIRTISKKLSNKFINIIEIRNSITHGVKLLGWKNYTGELASDSFLLKHSKLKKDGLDKNSMIIRTSTIERIINQVRLIDSCYMSLATIIEGGIREENRNEYIINLNQTIEKIGKVSLDFEMKGIK